MASNNEFRINNSSFNCKHFIDSLVTGEDFQLRKVSKEDPICNNYIFLKNKINSFLQAISDLDDDYKCNILSIVDNDCSSDKAKELSQLLNTLISEKNKLDELHQNNIYDDISFRKLDFPMSKLNELSKNDAEFISSSFLLDGHWSNHLFQSFSIGIIIASSIAYFIQNPPLSLCGAIVFGVASYSYQSYKNYYQPNNRIEHISNQLVHIEEDIIKLHNEIIDYGSS